MIQLYRGDCLEEIKKIPDKSVDLVLTDPPYNIGKADWDKIEGYIDWCAEWIKECARVLKDNGSMYIWHNDMPQLAELMGRIKKDGLFAYVSFCVWDKTEAYRARSWKQRDAKGKTALRSWFNRCEYCVEFAKNGGTNTAWDRTGRDRINSNAECYKPIKNWYRDEMTRLGIDEKRIAEAYEKATGKKPHMLRHYFQDSQFAIPTREVWENVYMPLGFGKSYEELRESYEELRESYEELRESYEELRESYEELRESYEELRYYHRCDEKHCNMWTRPVLQASQKKSGHPCEKPVDILRRIIRVSCRPGGAVLDLFMGGGSTGVAAVCEDRGFIGIERDEKWFDIAKKRIEGTNDQVSMFRMMEGT